MKISNYQLVISYYSIGKSLRMIILIAGAICLQALTSCDHKDLCYEHRHTSKIRVVYDWTYAPDASPAGMCVFFYSIDRQGEYHRFDFKGTAGGEVELPAGNYELISYNNDTEMVQFSSTASFDNHTAYTRTGDILEPMFGNGVTSSATQENDERVVITPDGLWGCTATDVKITEHGVTYTHEKYTEDGKRLFAPTRTTEENGDQIITLYPQDKLCHYSYEVRNVKNIKHISKVSGALSGMSGTLNMSTDSLGTELVTLPVPGQTDTATDRVTGSFLTFGHHGTNEAAHKMTFFVMMDDGTKYSFKGQPNLDVTQQVDTASDRRHVHIIIDGLNVPTPMTDDGIFTPSVDDWGETDQDIKI